MFKLSQEKNNEELFMTVLVTWNLTKMIVSIAKNSNIEITAGRML